MNRLDNIPRELAELPNWFAVNANKKPTVKWSQASNRVPLDNLTLVGKQAPAFAFTAEDPYLFVDFDKTTLLEQDSPLHKFHHSCFLNSTTYTEISSSGKGFHLIYKCEEPWPQDKMNKSVQLQLEVYDRDRYCIFTGNVDNERYTIKDVPEQRELLIQAMPSRAASSTTESVAMTEEDAVVIRKMMELDNDNLLKNLGQQLRDNPNAIDTSSQEMALVNRIASITGNAEQIERIWLKHPISSRFWFDPSHTNANKTWARQDYREKTISIAMSSLNSYTNKRKEEMRLRKAFGEQLTDSSQQPLATGNESAKTDTGTSTVGETPPDNTNPQVPQESIKFEDGEITQAQRDALSPEDSLPLATENSASPTQPSEPVTPTETEPLPPMQDGGIMEAIVNYYNSSALHAFDEAAYFCATVYMSRYVNGTYVMPHQWRFGSLLSPLGTYSLIIAGTSTGKSFPLDIIRRIDDETSRMEVTLPLATRRGPYLEDDEKDLPYPFSKVKDKFQFRGKPPSGMGIRKALLEEGGRATFNIGEFEMFWKEMNNSTNPVMEDIKSNLLTGFDGAPHGKVNYSNEERDVKAVKEVFLNLCGEATPTLFPELDVKSVTNGFLNRFSIFIYEGPIPKPNFTGGDASLLNTLKERLVPFLRVVADVAITRKKLAVQMDEDASQYWREAYMDNVRLLNDQGDALLGALRARDFRKAQRLAVFRAVSRNPEEPRVILDDIKWAIDFSFGLSGRLADKFAKGEAGTESNFNKEAALVNVLNDYVYKPVKSNTYNKHKMLGIVTFKYIKEQCKALPAFMSDRFQDTNDKLGKAITALLKREVLIASCGPTELPSGKFVRARHYSIDCELLNQEV